MVTLHLSKGYTWLVTPDGQEIDCFIYEEQVFASLSDSDTVHHATRFRFDDFSGFYVKKERVCKSRFCSCVQRTKFSKKYKEQRRAIWGLCLSLLLKEVQEECSKGYVAPLKGKERGVDLSVDRVLLTDPIEGLPPVELVIEDNSMTLRRGLWEGKCWYASEYLYYWGYDSAGYECAFQISIYDIEMTYVNGWFFTQEQTVEYFKHYRTSLEQERLVAPLIVNHYHLNELVLEFVSSRHLLHTDTFAELSLHSDGVLLYRHPYSSRWLYCSVAGRTVNLPDGTLAVLKPGETLVTMPCRDFSDWLETMSLILNGHYDS